MQEIPTLVVRYEDLINERKQQVLNTTVHFLSGSTPSQGSNDEALYQPRSANRAAGYAKSLFPESVRAAIQAESQHVLCALGYDKEIMGNDFVCEAHATPPLPVRVAGAHDPNQFHQQHSTASTVVNRPVGACLRPCIAQQQCHSFVNAVSLWGHLNAAMRQGNPREL